MDLSVWAAPLLVGISIGLLTPTALPSTLNPSPLVQKGECKEGQVIENSNNKVVLSQNADHVGFCNDHAERDLLEQAICKRAEQDQKPSECFQPAVTEILAESAKLKKAGHPDMLGGPSTLDEILKNQKISSEDCLKLDNLFKTTSWSMYLVAGGGAYNRKFQASIHDVVYDQCMKSEQCPTCEALSRESSYEKLTKLKCELAARGPGDPNRNYLYTAIDNFKEESGCPEKNIPALRLDSMPYDLNNRQETAAKLNQLLGQGAPAGVGEQVQVVTTSPHAVVVSNYRVKCINGKKTLQYQILDSLYYTHLSLVGKNGDWIDGDKLLGKLNPHAVYHWLEPAQTTARLGFTYELPESRNDQSRFQDVKVKDVVTGSDAYQAGLRNGMIYLKSDVDPATKTVTVLVLENGKQKSITYKLSSP